MIKGKGLARSLFCCLLVAGFMAVFILRLADWQLINGAAFLAQAESSYSTKVAMPAARGEILDVNGVPLASNRTGWSIVFDRAYMESGTENKTILMLISLLEQRGEKWTDALPIEMSSEGGYAYSSGKEDEIKRLQGGEYAGVNAYATAGDCIRALAEKFNVEGYSAENTRKIISVRYNMVKTGFAISTPYTFAPDVSVETIAIIQENSSRLPGVSAAVTTTREYPSGGDLMPTIVGSVGAISESEYKEKKDQGYKLHDKIGKSGIESALEEHLRGKEGEKVVETTNRGSVTGETITKKPESGNTVYLTIDSEIQRVMNLSLAQNIEAARENGEMLASRDGKMHGQECQKGGAVLLRVKDFAVLGAAGYPSYDLERYLSDDVYMNEINSNPNNPLNDHALFTTYAPGSCFKPAVALAALQEGVINSGTHITCHRVYSRWPNEPFTCLGYHGSINVLTALQKSCNVFFYETGFNLGIDAMNQYSRRLGLGEKTGVEISENSGILAGPAENPDFMRQGADVIQAAIGQSHNMFTPLQLAAYTATIANNGSRLRAHVVSKITDYSRQNVVMENNPDNPGEPLAEIGVDQGYIDIVKQGMRQVVTGGTASTMFSDYGIAIAGKTGTAETGVGNSDNVAFIAYAPYDNPEVAVAVVLEHGAVGSYCQQVALDTLNAYFYDYRVDKNGNISSPEERAALDNPASSEGSGSSSEGAGSGSSSQG